MRRSGRRDEVGEAGAEAESGRAGWRKCLRAVRRRRRGTSMSGEFSERERGARDQRARGGSVSATGHQRSSFLESRRMLF